MQLVRARQGVEVCAVGEIIKTQGDALEWIDVCRDKCKKIKYIGGSFSWTQKPSRSSYLVANSELLDASRSTIPDLYLTGEYRLLRKGRGEIFSIALQFYWKPGELRRVFMIESYPSYMPSHRDQNGQIYGPHLHLGDDRLEQVVRKLHASEDGLPFSYWARRFVRHARVYAGHNGAAGIPSPHPGDLFG